MNRPFYKIGGFLALLLSSSIGVPCIFGLGASIWLLFKSDIASQSRPLEELAVLIGCAAVGMLGVWLLKRDGTGPLAKTNCRILIGVGIIIVPLVVFCIYLIPIIGMFTAMDDDMEFGKRYMNSLSDRDIQAWIERSKPLMKASKEWNSDLNVTEDLQKLRIIRVDSSSDSVSYVWMGGFDHTELMVTRNNDGTYKVTAQYNDYSERVLWPK